jgi:Sulfotransferase domain
VARVLPPAVRRRVVVASRSVPRLIAEARLRSGRSGRLPDFLIIGAQRCGTTYLHGLLAAHPDVGPPVAKEVEFFDRNWHRGLNWYRSYFPSARPKTGRRGSVTGEASPSYIFHPLAVERARTALPQARIVVLLRNPVDRAYSHYLHAVRLGFETMPFEEALAHEEKGPDSATQRMHDDQFSLSRHYSYLARGAYVEQLEEWMQAFPAEQLLVVRSEDFFADVRGTLARVTQFLGLEAQDLERIPPPKSFRYAPMDVRTRKRLVDHFRSWNQRLYALIGRDMEWDS